jgi:hypothetical protein
MTWPSLAPFGSFEALLNNGLKLASRLAALARAQSGSYCSGGASAAKAPAPSLSPNRSTDLTPACYSIATMAEGA